MTSNTSRSSMLLLCILLLCRTSRVVVAAVHSASPLPLPVWNESAVLFAEPRHPSRFRVYAFTPDYLTDNFKRYDWSRLGTLCLFGMDHVNFTLKQQRHIETIVATAHAKGVPVDMARAFPVSRLNETQEYQQEWIDSLLSVVETFHLDGVNIDTEDPIDLQDNATRDAFTALVRNIRVAMDLKFPDRTTYLSMDAAWSPRGIDGRFYDLNAIAQIVDMIFVMAYDMQSQIWKPNQCTARANSPLLRVQRGLDEFLALDHVTPSKLVLGVPWYGYDYPCKSKATTDFPTDTDDDICLLDLVPFRGAPCSDAAGRQVGVSEIFLKLLPLSTAGVVYDAHAASPYFDYNVIVNATTTNNNDATTTSTTSTTVIRHQVRFDCPKSLATKYKLAKHLGLAGVGFWNIDSLLYDDDEAHAKIRNDMFQALDAFLIDDDDNNNNNNNNQTGSQSTNSAITAQQ